MRIPKRLARAATGVSAFAIVATAVPTAGVSAQSNHGDDTKKDTHNFGQKKADKKQIVTLAAVKNAAVDVNTELDCTSHMLSAKVTNKTNAEITPTVTFNKDEPTIPSSYPIKPGKSATYFYNFTGNHLLVDTKVSVASYEDVISSSTLHCSEPVSFTVDQVSESAVTGYLANNSSLVPQTVLTRVNSGDIRTETLQPGESRLIALPFTSYEGQTSAQVTIGTTEGFEGSYWVDLKDGGIIRPLEE